MMLEERNNANGNADAGDFSGDTIHDLFDFTEAIIILEVLKS